MRNNGTWNVMSAYQVMHATIEESWVVVLSVNLCWQWHHATVKELQVAVFSVGPCRGCTWRIGTNLSQSRESLQVDKPVWVAPGRCEGGRGVPIVVSCCVVGRQRMWTWKLRKLLSDKWRRRQGELVCAVWLSNNTIVTVTVCKSPTIMITNPHFIYSHSIMCQYYPSIHIQVFQVVISLLVFQQKLCMYFSSLTCIPHLTFLSWIDQPNNVMGRVQIMKLIIMQISASYHFLS
jgi:hypothetical protein